MMNSNVQKTQSRIGHFTFCVACLLATLGMMISISILFAPNYAEAQAEDLVSVHKTGTSKAENAPDAARSIQAASTAETARELVMQILGEKRYAKNRVAVESKIIRQSSKFIPYVNPGPVTKAPDGSWTMDLDLKVSMNSMRKMILDAGLLNDSDGPASLLPLVAFTDRTKGISSRWWLGELSDKSADKANDDTRKFLASLSRSFYEKAQASFAKEGFHLIKPQTSQISPLPDAYRTEEPSAADLAFISDFFRAPMILKGDVRIRESKNVPGAYFCALRLQVIQPANNRSIAEVTRQFTTEVGAYDAVVRNKMTAEFPDVAKDLATQVLEVWQRGTLNTNLIDVTVRTRLTPKQLSDFKTQAIQSVREFKSLKERLFDNGQVVFEADYTGQPQQIADRLRQMNLTGFSTKVVDANAQNVSVDVVPR